MKLKRSMLWRLALPFCLLFVSPVTGWATQAIHSQTSEPVKTHLVAEEKSIQPGRPFWVGIDMNIESGWDTYWTNPGDSGFPTTIQWHLPAGFEASPVHWPYPEKFTNQSLVGYGYTHSTMLLTQITPPKDLKPGEQIKISADVSWLACKEQCVPGSAHLDLSLPVSAQIPEKNADALTAFSHYRQQVPQPLTKEMGTAAMAAQGDSMVLTFSPVKGVIGEIKDVLFIPEQGDVIDYGAAQHLTQSGDHYTLSMKKATTSSASKTEPVSGVLLITEKGSDVKKAIHLVTPIQTAGIAQQQGSAIITPEVSSLGLAIGLAFLGGLILNVMPCVLPVIALKIFSFVKMSQQKRSHVLKHGGIFTLGVMVSFWTLSGILLVLRAYGEGIGWGFQLQEPIFVAILASVLFLLGLSLFGVFELGTSLISLGQKTASSSTSPMTSSFMSGVLATVVATPCTGPLLGPALGFAMTLPPVMALSVFSAMGLGMAFPYLIFSAFPSLIRFLPKPGNWMIIFKQLMGFLMMGTVVWLIWVFGAQTDHLGVFFLLACLLIIAFGAWVFGKWASPASRKRTRLVASAVTLMLFLVGGTGVVRAAKQTYDVPQIEQQASDQWIAYSPEKVDTLRREGKSVFVDFTAKWCLICQANKVVLHSSEMTKAFKEKGVITMVADWTKRDAVITEQLQKMGRSGVPVYVLYSPDVGQAPEILPQTLTSTVVNDYLSHLSSLHVD